MCRESVSALNGVGFGVLLLAVVGCTLSLAAPFWIRYPHRFGVPMLDEMLQNPLMTQLQSYPFSKASWRGLFAACYKDASLMPNHDITATPKCAWFWQHDFGAQKTLPGWYQAAQCLFAIGVALLYLVIILESVYVCSQCCRRKACLPIAAGTLIVLACVLAIASLAIFAGFSYNAGEYTPDSTGGEGGLIDWSFYVGIASVGAAILSAILLFIDGCRLANIYSHYKPPSVSKT